MKDDIAEYNLYATRQMGIISSEIEKARANQYTKVESPSPGLSKTETLALAGVSKQRANEAEKLAAIPETRFAKNETFTNALFPACYFSWQCV